MNKMYRAFLSISIMAGTVFGARVPVAKTIGKSPQSSVVKSIGKSNQASPAGASGIVFQGMTEQGVTRDTFLCGEVSVTANSLAGANAESGDCSINKIKEAIGFDVSEGRTIQFFNNFTYWLRQKSQAEQLYRVDNPEASDSDVVSHMQKKGWASMGAYCVIISTNEILQEIIGQASLAGSKAVKVIAQLWYNGDSLIQLWSQDVAVMQPGQSFTIAISNAADADLSTSLQAFAHQAGYLNSIGKSMQPDNRNADSYTAAINSPRTIRIQVAS